VRIGRNLLAGVANSAWSAIVNLAAVPFYLNFLGIEAYGLIGFFVTTQALLQLLDMGMTPTINREVARCAASGKIEEAGNLLHSLAVIYWSLSIVIALLIYLLAPLISEYWLQSNQLSALTISHALMLMGLVVACRWPIGLYQGALIGAQRLTVSSGINMVMVTIGAVGAVSVLAFVSPTIEAFFIWQAGVGVVYAIAMRTAAWRIIGKIQHLKFDVEKLKSVWRFTAGMSGIGLTALAFTQLDKVILSKILDLDEFGVYMLATVVVSALYILINPVFNVIYPRMSALVVTEDTEKLAELYRLGARLLASLLFPVAMVLVVFAEDIVFLWTGNPALASEVAPIISLLAIGSALHGVMYFPYALQLAYGRTGLVLRINIVLMIVLTPLLVYLALTYGVLGGAMAWLLLHIFNVILATWVTHRHFLVGLGSRWLFHDIGVPLILLVVTGAIAHFLVEAIDSPIYIRLLAGCVLALIASALSIFASSQLRAAISNWLQWRNGAVAS
jgi:O-antigen/teichoic acid export membrane protein